MEPTEDELWETPAAKRKKLNLEVEDIDPPELRLICAELQGVQHHFIEFGIQLGIPRNKLMDFKNDPNPFSAAVNFWLNGNVKEVPVSWKSIVEALRNIGEKGLARIVSEKYCQQQKRKGGILNDSEATNSETVNLFVGELKYVRWDYTSKTRNELTVRNGDEVEILKLGNEENLWMVRRLVGGHTGLIPKKCFYPRLMVTLAHEPKPSSKYDNEVSVKEGEVIGVMKRGAMYKIMKDDGKTVGYIPEHCMYVQYKVYSAYTRKNQEELSVEEGNNAGRVDKKIHNRYYWKVYYQGETGLVPSKCFEPPAQVHWKHTSQREDELSVKKGDIVNLVNHYLPQTDEERVLVRHINDVGWIPKSCFEVISEVYWDNITTGSNSELIVKKGIRVGIVETNENPPEGLEGCLKVRLQTGKVGWVPKKCFEVPAKVITNYRAAKANELTVERGQDVRIMDATTFIKVRLGNSQLQGDVPLRCINVNMEKIMRLIRNDSLMLTHDDESTPLAYETAAQHVNVDTNALKSPLDINDAGDVEEILQGTDIDKICEVGLALGLSMKSIRKLRFTEEMVSAWLQRKDDVEATTGTPSWESLESALQKEGLSGASEMIVKNNTRLESTQVSNLRWRNEKNRAQDIKIAAEACSKWREIGHLVDIPATKLEEIYKQHRENIKRFEAVVRLWIQDGATKYPATWLGLCRVLNSTNLSPTADKIKKAMPYLKF